MAVWTGSVTWTYDARNDQARFRQNIPAEHFGVAGNLGITFNGEDSPRTSLQNVVQTVLPGGTTYPANLWVTIRGHGHKLVVTGPGGATIPWRIPAEDQAAYNSFIDEIQGGATTYDVTVADFEPKDILIRAATGPPAAEAALADTESFDLTWPITEADASGTWVSIGADAASDDVAVPSDILASGAASNLDWIRVRTGQVRMFFAQGSGRLTPSFEASGQVLITDAENGDILAGLSNFSSKWNDRSNQYRFNSDNEFTIGSRASLRQAIEGLGVGHDIQIFFIRPPLSLALDVRVPAPSARANARPGSAAISAAAGTPTAAADALGHTDIRLRHNSAGTPTARVSVQASTKIRLSVSAGIPAARAQASGGQPRLSASAGQPQPSVNVKNGTTIRFEDGTGVPRAAANVLHGTKLRIEDGAGVPRAAVQVQRFTELRLRSSWGLPSAFGNVERQIDLRTPEVSAGTPAAMISLESHLGFRIFKRGWRRPQITANLARHTDLRISAAAETARAEITLEDLRGLGIDQRTGTFAARARLLGPTLGLSAATGATLASIRLSGLDISLAAATGVPAAQARARQPDPKLAASAGVPAARGNVQHGVDLKIRLAWGAVTALVDVESHNGLQIRRQAWRRPRASAGLENQTRLWGSASAGIPQASVRARPAQPEIGASAGSPTASAGLSLRLHLSASAGTPAAAVDLFEPTDLVIGVSAGSPSTYFNLLGPTLELSAGAGVPAASATVPAPLRPRDLAREALADHQVADISWRTDADTVAWRTDVE